MVKFFLRIINKINNDFKEYIVKTAIVVSILATVYLLSENIFLSFIIGFAAAILLLGWDSRVFIGFGLIFLIACPFLLAFEKKSTAEEMAVYAYYMLALGVVLQIVQYFKDSIFSGSQTQKINNPGQIEFWGKKKVLSFALATAGLGLVVFVGCFCFLYLKMENKFNEDKKFISDFINIRLEGEAQAKENITAKQPEPTDGGPENTEINWESVKVLVSNATGQEGLGEAVAEKFRKLGAPNVRMSRITSPPNQKTSVEYCTGCSNIAAELLAALPSPEMVSSEENPSLRGEIRIELGPDQITSSER